MGEAVENKKVKDKLKAWWAEARKSLTMWVAALWVVLGVAETQVNLLQPLIGDKWFGVVSIAISGSLALARMRTLGKK
jgi:hypothetical protein